MSKYIGFAIIFAFFATYVYRKLRPARLKEVKSLRTGISRWTYALVTLLIFLGGIVLPMGVAELVTEVQRETDWIPATGFVTEHVQSGTNRGRPTYRTRFHYQTSEETGRVDHEVLDERATEHPLPVSTSIQVLYDPSNPEVAEIDTFQERWMLPVILVIAGLVTLGYSLAAIVLIARLQSLARLARRNINVGTGDGRLVHVKRNIVLSLKNAPSWTLVVEYTDLANKKHIAKSEPIWDLHPDAWAKTEVPVPLSIDRADPSRAWVRVQDYIQRCKQSVV